MQSAESVAALVRRYEAIAYGALPHPPTHPAHLAAMATAFGLQVPGVQRCRVLEVGCSDGANLLPMAATLPDAYFVGCDVARGAIEAASAAAEGAGLRNVTLCCEDLAALDPALGAFDFIVAHGVYSWVPSPVRDALFGLARERLAPGGVLYVSYNVLPGYRLRQAACEMVRRHVDAIVDARERLAATRSFARLLADGARSQYASEDGLRAELRAIAQSSDSDLFHDDFAIVNEPVYFRDFAAHAARWSLAWLAEADLHTMLAGGLAPGALQWLARLDVLAREEHVDLLRQRRFRQSLLRRAQDMPTATPFAPERMAALDAVAQPSLLQAAAAGNLGTLAGQLAPRASAAAARLLEDLVACAPAALPLAGACARLGSAAAAEGPVVLRDACMSGLVGLQARGGVALARASSVGPQPRTSGLARWQAARQPTVTSLRHLPVRMPDSMRQLLVLLDGTRDRAALAAALAAKGGVAAQGVAAQGVAAQGMAAQGVAAQGVADSAAMVERMLDELGRSAFLLA
jgi:SAM-dependent methyltransferase